jgi:hypothetical protein
MMLHQPKVKQINFDLANKTLNILNYLFQTYPPHWEIWFLILFLVLIIASLWWKRIEIRNFVFKHSKMALSQDHVFLTALFILLPAVVLNLLVPVPILPHYIFGLLTIGIVLVSSLPHPFRLLLISCALVFWITPVLTDQYFHPAPRTVSQLQSCYQKYCQAVHDPLYVSLQSGLLPFHNGPEHRYLLRQAGCDVKDIETEKNAAQLMAVIVESSDFTFGKTSYAELTAFNPRKELNQLTCEPSLQIITLGN